MFNFKTNQKIKVGDIIRTKEDGREFEVYKIRNMLPYPLHVKCEEEADGYLVFGYDEVELVEDDS